MTPQPDHDPTWGRTWGVGHEIRRFTLGSGPLRRNTDRAEFALRIVTLCVLLLSVPLGCAVGSSVHAGLAARSAAERADLTRVQATVVGPAAADTDPTVTDRRSREAIWPTPDGGSTTGLVLVDEDVRTHDLVPVWVDDQGRRHSAPLDAWQVTVQSAVLGGLSVLAVLAIQLVGHAGVLSVINRRRARQWARGWAEVGPAWRRQLR